MVGREPGTDEYMQLKIADFGLSAQRSEAKVFFFCVCVCVCVCVSLCV